LTYLLGTDVLLDHLHDRRAATDAIGRALRSGRRVTASVLTRVELRRRAGMEHAAALEALEGLVEWVPVDHAIAGIAAELAERYGAGDETVALADYVVAATAQRIDADLLTCNVQQFPMFPNLEAPY
jgi:predicted nucleic acid-binding protein